MTQTIRLLTTAITQPAQHLLPIRIVEETVSTQDKQSSRHTSESTSIFMFYLHSEAEARPRSEEVRHNLGNLGPSWGVPYISEGEIRVAPPPGGQVSVGETSRLHSLTLAAAPPASPDLAAFCGLTVSPGVRIHPLKPRKCCPKSCPTPRNRSSRNVTECN